MNSVAHVSFFFEEDHNNDLDFATKLTTSRTVNTINATGSLSGTYSSYPELSQED